MTTFDPNSALIGNRPPEPEAPPMPPAFHGMSVIGEEPYRYHTERVIRANILNEYWLFPNYDSIWVVKHLICPPIIGYNPREQTSRRFAGDIVAVVDGYEVYRANVEALMDSYLAPPSMQDIEFNHDHNFRIHYDNHNFDAPQEGFTLEIRGIEYRRPA